MVWWTGGGGGMPIGIGAEYSVSALFKLGGCVASDMCVEPKPTWDDIAADSASASSAENRSSLDPITGGFGGGSERDIDVMVEERSFVIPVVSPLSFFAFCICIGISVGVCIIDAKGFAVALVAFEVMSSKLMTSELWVLFELENGSLCAVNGSFCVAMSSRLLVAGVAMGALWVVAVLYAEANPNGSSLEVVAGAVPLPRPPPSKSPVAAVEFVLPASFEAAPKSKRSPTGCFGVGSKEPNKSSTVGAFAAALAAFSASACALSSSSMISSRVFSFLPSSENFLVCRLAILIISSMP
mmetsp:Transcript_26935/g.74034  ORF Transcript_26935/g.74034 Transcript_26935/m.74034 type:complete len:298 (+) Transcript_26935:329-1222(+)